MDENHVLGRWVEAGTIHAATEYSLVCVTGELDYLEKSVINPFLTIYVDMVKLALAQRAIITKIEYEGQQTSNKINTQVDANHEPESVLTEVEKVWQKYISFENQIYLPEVTYQEQGVEIYPIIMSETKVVTSSGELSLPRHGDYDAKEGFASGYYNLMTGEIEHDIFHSQYRVENRKNNFEETTHEDEERDGGLFKREMLSMKEGYAFAVFLDADYFPEKSFGKMGKKKCPYYVFSEKKANDLESQVKKAFRNSSVWYYALSDLCPVQYVRPDMFFMSDTDYIRNIETDYQEKTHNKKFKKSHHSRVCHECHIIAYLPTCGIPMVSLFEDVRYKNLLIFLNK